MPYAMALQQRACALMAPGLNSRPAPWRAVMAVETLIHKRALKAAPTARVVVPPRPIAMVLFAMVLRVSQVARATIRTVDAMIRVIAEIALLGLLAIARLDAKQIPCLTLGIL